MAAWKSVYVLSCKSRRKKEGKSYGFLAAKCLSEMALLGLRHC